MRLWTVNPEYLDAKGLVGLWRESLLAQKVLAGETLGYRNHPQLDRFKSQENPLAAISQYLRFLYAEAVRRGYRFDARKIGAYKFEGEIIETEGQLLYEWQYLKHKLKGRNEAAYLSICEVELPKPHPLFRIVKGNIRYWERPISFLMSRLDDTSLDRALGK